ncbi:MAG: hypothetical protein J6K89_08650 [Oscillospiraceae bacterium]|nr:hypothetical protein [Oscillospiraceae bacterium]
MDFIGAFFLGEKLKNVSGYVNQIPIFRTIRRGAHCASDNRQELVVVKNVSIFWEIHYFRWFLCSCRSVMNRTRKARPYAAVNEAARQIGIW